MRCVEALSLELAHPVNRVLGMGESIRSQDNFWEYNAISTEMQHYETDEMANPIQNHVTESGLIAEEWIHASRFRGMSDFCNDTNSSEAGEKAAHTARKQIYNYRRVEDAGGIVDHKSRSMSSSSRDHQSGPSNSERLDQASCNCARSAEDGRWRGEVTVQ